MAMTAELQQVRNAIFGESCPFVLSVSNSDAVNGVDIESLFVSVTTPSGEPTMAYRLGTIAAPPGVATIGPAGGSQLNINVPPSSSRKLSLPIAFLGPLVAGAEANASSVFRVAVVATFSDGTTYTTPSLFVSPSRPIFGRAPGSPPNELPLVGQLNFTTPAASGLAL